MSASRPRTVAALTAVGLVGVACVYWLLDDGAGSTSLAKPALQVAEHKVAPKRTDEFVADHEPSARIAVAPAAATGPTPLAVEASKPANSRGVEETLWEKEFAGMKREELLEARNKISHELSDLTSEPLQTAFETGRYEVIGHSKKSPFNNETNYSFNSETWDHAQIGAVQVPAKTDVIRKAVLSESEYPELYALKRKMLWLKNQAQRPERQD